MGNQRSILCAEASSAFCFYWPSPPCFLWHFSSSTTIRHFCTTPRPMTTPSQTRSLNHLRAIQSLFKFRPSLRMYWFSFKAWKPTVMAIGALLRLLIALTCIVNRSKQSVTVVSLPHTSPIHFQVRGQLTPGYALTPRRYRSVTNGPLLPSSKLALKQKMWAMLVMSSVPQTRRQEFTW